MKPMRLYNSGAALRRQIEETALPERFAAVWALGQAGFFLKLGDKRIVIDPYLTNSVYDSGATMWARKFDPPLAPDELPAFDLVMSSHHHDDHMDIATLTPLSRRPGIKLALPRAHEATVKAWGYASEQLIGLNHMETATIDGMEVKALAAQHDRFETDEQGNHRYLGYIIKYNGVTVYHAGDTIGFPELVEWLRAERIDLALVPINGRDFARTAKDIIGNMNYREAIDLCVAAGIDTIVPMHYGMFPLNDENPAYFVDYLYANYPQQKFHMMTVGERYIYMK